MGDVPRHSGMDSREELVIGRKALNNNDKGRHDASALVERILPPLGLSFCLDAGHWAPSPSLRKVSEAAGLNGQPGNATDRAQVKNLHKMPLDLPYIGPI